MEFEAFLISKKIDPLQFSVNDKLLFESWKTAFEQYHIDSFVAQYKFSINQIRRKYLLIVEKSI